MLVDRPSDSRFRTLTSIVYIEFDSFYASFSNVFFSLTEGNAGNFCALFFFVTVVVCATCFSLPFFPEQLSFRVFFIGPPGSQT